MTLAVVESVQGRSTAQILLGLLVGSGSACFGLLPWLATGGILPLQNLWAVPTLPADMPFVLLPFSQYELPLLVSLMVVGSATAGLILRLLAERARRPVTVAAVLGVVLVQGTATVRTRGTVSNGLSEHPFADAYLTGLVSAAVAGIAVGIVVLLLIADAPRPGAAIGLSVAGVLLLHWVQGYVFTSGSWFAPLASLVPIRWIPAIVVGAAVVWCGINTIGRGVAALVSLLILWIGPAVILGVQSAAGSRVLAGRPREMVDHGMRTVLSALEPQGASAALVVVAVVVIGLGLAVRSLVSRSRRNA